MSQIKQMCQTTSLADLPVNCLAKIISLDSSGAFKRRLLDLGFIPGTKIKVAFTGPLGDPRAYFIRDTLMALRASEARAIKVRRLSP